MRTEADALLSLQRYFADVLPEPWDVRVKVEAGREPDRPYALVEQNGPSSTTGAPVTQDVTAAYSVNLYLPTVEGELRKTAELRALQWREVVWQAVKWGPDPRRPTTDRIPLFSFTPRLEVQRLSFTRATGGWLLVGYGGAWTPPIAWDADLPAVQSAFDALDRDAFAVERRASRIFDVHFGGDLAGQPVDLLEVDDDALESIAAPTVGRRLSAAPAPWRSDRDYLRVESFSMTTVQDEDAPALLMVAVELRCAFARGLPVPFGQMLLQRLNATAGNTGG